MIHVLFFLALISFLLFILLGIIIIRGNQTIPYLRDIEIREDLPKPKISVVIAARNEERKIEKALQSMINQDYENLEILIINDRSTDRTGEILDRMAKTNPKLKIFHLTDLPKGWLGKNYALHYGATHATGDYILFTDADVMMNPDTVTKALYYMQKNQIDHLAISPNPEVPGLILKFFIVAFILFFGIYSQPWNARKPKSKKFIGIGAFNMLRADIYKSMGGHQPIAMRPDDDIKLGKLVKTKGFRQDFLFGTGMIQVEWYQSVSELLRGMEKNAYAGINYNFLYLVISSVLIFIFYLWPVLGMIFTSGMIQFLNILIVCGILIILADALEKQDIEVLYVLGYPIGVAIFIYIMWRSAILIMFNRGMQWRDTFYSIKELKANKF